MRALSFAAFILAAAAPLAAAQAQPRVSPSSVNVNAQGVTTAILTFSGVGGYFGGDAVWCGALVSPTPSNGPQCEPGTIYGQLPARYARTGGASFDGFTDVMSIPASVSRRAYQDAAAGSNSAFYYVRRFRSDLEGLDQFVAVTLRLTAGGAQTPLALTDVKLTFLPEVPVLYVANGDVPSDVEARLRYTGSGRLSGRWEIVYPGEAVPSSSELVTAATPSSSEQGAPRRFAQLSRFNIFLPPTGRITIPGPDAARLPTSVDGSYFLLLRIESALDAASQRTISSTVDGETIFGSAAASGGVAGFALPTLRYVVGSGPASKPASARRVGLVRLRSPGANAQVDATALDFAWDGASRAEQYRVEVTTPDGVRVLAALLPSATKHYVAPPWLASKAPVARLRWRVIALDARGREIGRSNWSALTLAQLARSSRP